MHLVRLSPLMLLLGLAFFPPSALARQDKDPVDSKPSGYYSISNLKTNPIGNDKLDEVKPKIVAFAQYQADVISWPRRYTLLQDPVAKLNNNQYLEGSDGILNELDRHILVPSPQTKLGSGSANYVRELGQALDDSLKEVILKNPDRVIRVNATRMLAIACKSGAHAHYPTVTALLANPTIRVGEADVAIPAEVKYYALQAAGNLLAAYNLASFNPVQDGYNNRQHSIDDDAVVKLLAAVEKAVVDPMSLLNVQAEDAKTPETRAVAAYFRRQAVRALAQCRYSAFPEKNPTQFPSVVLARIAVSDPSLGISPRADEIAEAVIGICNMDPPSRAAERTPYGVGMADVLATAMVTYGSDRSANPPDKVVAWRGYAVRMREAFSKWRVRFDGAVLPIKLTSNSFDPDRAGAFNPDIVPLVAKTYDRAKTAILDPIIAGNRPQLESMRTFLLQEVRKGMENDPTITLFTNPKLAVPRKKV